MANKTIDAYARAGERHDVMQALILLTHAYISQCGISLGNRTVIYCAAEAWQERLAWMDLPLSELARKVPFFKLMPHLSSEYDPELYDMYDIAGLNEEELLEICERIVSSDEFDRATLEVICCGVLKNTEEAELPTEITTTTADGIILRGVVTRQKICSTDVCMTFPYNLKASRPMLIRDARELLVDAYRDYMRLYHSQNQVRALYHKYKEELKKQNNASGRRKNSLFKDVYGELLNDTVLVSPAHLFSEWHGLDF